MLHRYFYLIFILCSYYSYGQVVIVKHEEKPIGQVKVLVKDSTGQILDFTQTNSDGIVDISSYKIPFSLNFSHIDFELSFLTVSSENLQKEYVVHLKSVIESLDEIIINSVPNITVRGDTTTITLSRFRDGEERSLKDLLPKLPDVTISSDNTVYYKKKKITNVLVNGISIFDEEYKGVIGDLNPSQMMTIQFIENHYAETAFTDEVSKSTAMNLQFEDGFIISGSTHLGYGVQNTYDNYINTLVASKGFSAFIDLDHNNLGRNNANEDLTLLPSRSIYRDMELNTLSIPLDIEASVSSDLLANNTKLGFKDSHGTEFQIKTHSALVSMNRSSSLTESFKLSDLSFVQRDYFENNQIDYDVNMIELGTKSFKDNYFFKNTLSFNNTNYNWDSSNTLNGSEGELNQNYKKVQLDYSGRYERRNKNKLVSYFDYTVQFKNEASNLNITDAIVEEGQNVEVTSLSNNLTFYKQLVKDKQLEKSIFLKPSLEFIEMKLSDDFLGVSYSKEFLSHVSLFYRYKKINIESSKSLKYNVGLEYFSFINDSKAYNYILPAAEINYDFGKKIKQALSVRLNNQWIGNRAPRNTTPNL